MLALLDPSRQDVPEYADYRRDRARGGGGERASAATAGSPSTSGSPTTFRSTMAAYKQFDVLLVNAVYDGLNLVAKEGPLGERA